MAMLNITISGRNSSQRMRKVLENGQTVRIGRAAKMGWDVPWDQMISREHAVLSFIDGALNVDCLAHALNSIVYHGQPVRKARVDPDDWFQIGETTFHASH